LLNFNRCRIFFIQRRAIDYDKTHQYLLSATAKCPHHSVAVLPL